MNHFRHRRFRTHSLSHNNHFLTIIIIAVCIIFLFFWTPFSISDPLFGTINNVPLWRGNGYCSGEYGSAMDQVSMLFGSESGCSIIQVLFWVSLSLGGYSLFKLFDR